MDQVKITVAFICHASQKVHPLHLSLSPPGGTAHSYTLTFHLTATHHPPVEGVCYTLWREAATFLSGNMVGKSRFGTKLGINSIRLAQ